MAKFIDTTKIDKDLLDKVISKQLNGEKPSVPQQKEDFTFNLADGYSENSYAVYATLQYFNNKQSIGVKVHVCHSQYLDDNQMVTKKRGRGFRLVRDQMSKKEAYDLKEEMQYEITNKLFRTKGGFSVESGNYVTDRERSNWFK